MKRRLAIVAAFALAVVVAPSVPPAAALEEADRLFLVGERAMADRFFPVARRALERFAAQYPGDSRQPRALFMLGQARLALGDAESALEALTRAQPGLTEPRDVQEAKFWQAEAQFRLKRFAEARALYDEVFRSDAAGPRAPEALYGMGLSELELKNPEPAITALREFLATWSDHALAPSATLHLARALVDTKRVSEALPLLSAFATKYPRSRVAPDAQYLLGWVKYTTGDRQGGLADLKTFVDAYPNHAEAPAARQLLAQGYAKYGDRAQRLEAYKALMAQDPPTAEAYYEAARIATGVGLRDKLDDAWRKLSAQFPNDALTRKLAGELAANAFKQKNWKEAVALGTIAGQSEDDAARADAWLIVGESELKQRRFAQAAKAFEAVGAVKDVEAEARFRALAGLGLAREELKEWKAALAAYETVVNKCPDPTLRDWARERVAAVKPLATRPANGTSPKPAKPSDKPGNKRS